MEQGRISVQTDNIFPIIKKFLYADHEIFLRELVSNAVDASNKLKVLASKGEFTGEIGDLTIDIILDEKAKTLTIRDRGIGMSEAEVKKYLNQMAFSSAESFLKKYKDDANIIGHFGLGFYSAFMVSDKVEVVTKSYKTSPKPVKWTCTGEPSYTMESAEKSDRGTDVILYINEENKEFLQKSRIDALLDKYCKFLPIPIRFGKKTETEYEGEGKDQKTIEKEVDNIINNPDPIWKKNATDLKDEDYKSFYQELYPYSPEPLFWIHLNIDYPFNLTGVLYFPKLSSSIEIQKNKIQLYSNQVFVTDDVKEIVPEFLTLLHGVIDSPDIPLNVSRSYLQSDPNVKKINGYITRKVADKLSELFKNDRKTFEEKWDQIGTLVKYGMVSEDKFYEKVQPIALFKDTQDHYYTWDELIEKTKEAQTDKNGKHKLLYTNHPIAQDRFIRLANARSYVVLDLSGVLDNHFMQHLEYKNQDVGFARVDADTMDKLIEKEENRELVLSEDQKKKVEELFKAVIEKQKDADLKIEALSPDDAPVQITRPEFMRRMKEMQRLQGQDSMPFPDSYNLIVNGNHPLIAQKLVSMRSEEKKQRFSKYLVDLARLDQQMLEGEELSAFIKSSLEMMGE
jgi:molecular chaperone HtpG